MANASDTYGAQASGSDDGWSRATPVRSGGDAPRRPSPRVVVPAPQTQAPRPQDAGTQSPRPTASRPQGNRPPTPRTRVEPEWGARPAHAPSNPLAQARDSVREDRRDAERPFERGLPAWGGLIALLIVLSIGGLIDTVTKSSERGGFNVGIVIASIVAILLVRRSAMFPIVVAPPIVYAVISGVLLYTSSSGLHDHKVFIKTAANWVTYGFPAMAAATAAVLIIAGIRMVVRR